MTASHAPAATAGFYLRRVVHLAAVIDGTPADHALCGMNLQYGAIDTTADATCPECREVAARLAAATPAEEPAERIAAEVAESATPAYLLPALDAYGKALNAHGQTFGETPACECGRPFRTRRGVGLHVAAEHKRAEREYTAAAAIARNRHRTENLTSTERLAAQYGVPVEQVAATAREVVDEALAPAPVHHTREQIAARFDEADEFVIVLGPDDTAYDPETGDTFLGGVTIRYARGEFPGPARTATIVDDEPAVDDDPREQPTPVDWSEEVGEHTGTEWVVYCPRHRHYLVFAGTTGTTWTDEQDNARRYSKHDAGQAAERATWLDHNPTRWALPARTSA